jgi:hypothetical protein
MPSLTGFSSESCVDALQGVVQESRDEEQYLFNHSSRLAGNAAECSFGAVTAEEVLALIPKD